MSAKISQFLGETLFDNLKAERDFIQIYHQHGANLNDSNKKIDLFFGKVNNYYQRGNECLFFEVTMKKDGGTFEDDNTRVIRLVNNVVAHIFQEVTVITNGGSEIETKKFVGPVSIITRVLLSKDGIFSSYFDKINENNLNNTTLEKTPNDNPTVQDNNGKVSGQLPLEHDFGFCNTFGKVTKELDFPITSKRNDLHDFVYTTLPLAIFKNKTFHNLALIVPSFTPIPGTQVIFNESMETSFTLSFESWTTDRGVFSTGSEYQINNGSSEKLSVQKF